LIPVTTRTIENDGNDPELKSRRARRFSRSRLFPSFAIVRVVAVTEFFEEIAPCPA